MSIHVLQFFSTLNNGGAENRMMDVYRCIDPAVVTFDFAVVHEGKHFFDDEILAAGSQKYILPNPRANLLKNYRELVAFFRSHSFQAVHAHVSWYGGIVLMAARRAGVKIRIAHARDSAFPNRSMKDALFCNIGKILIGMFATQKIAISKEAAENVFGKRAVNRGDYLFVPNAIDEKKYAVLQQEARNALRNQLGIPEGVKAYVCVANLRMQKNHMFLLDIAAALKEKNDPFVLYLIGEGNLRQPITEKIQALGLEEHVVLMGSRKDVPQILCAFDCMIFPSFFEGLGGVVLESQLVGVPAVVSHAIPSVADVGIDMVEYLSLTDSPTKWAETVIHKTEHFSWNRENTLRKFKNAGYTIETTAEAYLREYGVDSVTIDKALRKTK